MFYSTHKTRADPRAQAWRIKFSYRNIHACPKCIFASSWPNISVLIYTLRPLERDKKFDEPSKPASGHPRCGQSSRSTGDASRCGPALILAHQPNRYSRLLVMAFWPPLCSSRRLTALVRRSKKKRLPTATGAGSDR